MGLARAALVLAPTLAWVHGCGETITSPDPASTPDVAVYFGRRGTVLVDADGKLRPLTELTGSNVAGWTAPEAGLAFAEVDDGQRALVAVDICTGSRAHEWPLGVPSGSDGLALRNVSVGAVDSEGSRLAIWEALNEDQSGVAVIDIDTGGMLGFLGGLRPSFGGIVLPPRVGASLHGGLVVLGRRDGGEEMVFLATEDGSVVDSATAQRLVGVHDDLWQILPSADGSSLVVAGASVVAQVRIPDLTLEWAWPRLGHGSVAHATASRLLLTDGGVWPHDPGSGYVFLLDPTTGAVDSIDVSTPMGGTPGTHTSTVTLSAVVEPASATAFIVAGTPPRGPTYPVQPPRILVVSLDERRVVESIDVAGLGLGGMGLARGCGPPSAR